MEKHPDHVVVECNGLGYFLVISLQTFSNIPDQENTHLFTHQVIREDAHTLYGFFSKTEREIFKLLLSVSGVGPSTAITMLSSMDTDEIQEAIAREDVRPSLKKLQKARSCRMTTATPKSMPNPATAGCQ